MKQPNLNRLNGRNATDAGGPLMQAALPGLRASAVRDLGRGISHHAWTQDTQGLSFSPVSHRIECVATARNGDAGTGTNNAAVIETAAGVQLAFFQPAAPADPVGIFRLTRSRGTDRPGTLLHRFQSPPPLTLLIAALLAPLAALRAADEPKPQHHRHSRR